MGPSLQGRHSAVPAAPGYSRRELEVLDEVQGPLGFVLWRVLSDALLWARAPAGSRAGLLAPGGTPEAALAPGLALAPAVEAELRLLGSLSGEGDASVVAAACARVAEWAEGEELKGVALQFAEAAAWAEPESSAQAWSAGRLCRRVGEFERATLWLRRAIRLARRDGSEIDFANAHRGMGFVFLDQGRFAEAEPHLWKCVRAALRVGRRSLAGSGYHDLLLVAVHLQRWDDALVYALKAIDMYRVDHPRFPLLAHDVALFWCDRGYFSSGLEVFERVLPLVQHRRERILVYASMAQSAAAVRDSIRFRRAAAQVMELAGADSEMTASSLYRVGEGARCFHDWTLAEALGRDALRVAADRQNAVVAEHARRLVAAAQQQLIGADDTVPPEGSIVDRTRGVLLRKLCRHHAVSKRSASAAAVLTGPAAD